MALKQISEIQKLIQAPQPHWSLLFNGLIPSELNLVKPLELIYSFSSFSLFSFYPFIFICRVFFCFVIFYLQSTFPTLVFIFRNPPFVSFLSLLLLVLFFDSLVSNSSSVISLWAMVEKNSCLYCLLATCNNTDFADSDHAEFVSLHADIVFVTARHTAPWRVSTSLQSPGLVITLPPIPKADEGFHVDLQSSEAGNISSSHVLGLFC